MVVKLPFQVYIMRVLDWKDVISLHNKNAKSQRMSYKRVVFIYERTFNHIVESAKKNHPNEISIELLFDGEVSKQTFKDYKPKGFFNKWQWQYKVLGKIINISIGNSLSVSSLPTIREYHFGYYTTPYPNFDAQLHTHTIIGSYELSKADIKKSQNLPGPSFLLVYPYTINDLIGWYFNGYALNIVIVDDNLNVII